MQHSSYTSWLLLQSTLERGIQFIWAYSYSYSQLKSAKSMTLQIMVSVSFKSIFPCFSSGWYFVTVSFWLRIIGHSIASGNWIFGGVYWETWFWSLCLHHMDQILEKIFVSKMDNTTASIGSILLWIGPCPSHCVCILAQLVLYCLLSSPLAFNGSFLLLLLCSWAKYPTHFTWYIC